MGMIYISYIRKHNGQKRPITVYDYIITNRKDDILSINEKSSKWHCIHGIINQKMR